MYALYIDRTDAAHEQKSSVDRSWQGKLTASADLGFIGFKGLGASGLRGLGFRGLCVGGLGLRNKSFSKKWKAGRPTTYPQTNSSLNH